MKLEDALAKNEDKNFRLDSNEIFLIGTLESEDSQNFRLYPDPRNKNQFFLIKNNQVTGDLYEYSKEEVEKLGFTTFLLEPRNNFNIYQVPLMKGEEVDFIIKKKAKLGEFYPNESLSSSLMMGMESLKLNQQSNDCGCGCGGDKTSTAKSLLTPGYCDGRKPPCTGATPCMWISPFGSWCSDCCT